MYEYQEKRYTHKYQRVLFKTMILPKLKKSENSEDIQKIFRDNILSKLKQKFSNEEQMNMRIE